MPSISASVAVRIVISVMLFRVEGSRLKVASPFDLEL